MKAYSEDLRRKIVEATERGGVSKRLRRPRLFGVSLSSVKRYARSARRGGSLAPGKGSGRPPKIDDEGAKKPLEKDVEERPAATVSERRRFPEHLTGESLSDSTVGRMLKRMGFAQENGAWGRWKGTNS